MSTSRKPRIALALAGGGPLGAIHEIGALCALQEALDGVAFERLHHYVGVSAGGFIAAALANGMTPRQLCAAFIENRDGHEVFDPAWLLVPAYGEFLRRGRRLPRLAAATAWDLARGKPLARSLQRLGGALPTGLFANEAIAHRLAQAFAQPGRTNDFRHLRTRLTLVATDLDTGEATPFGSAGWDHVPIATAVQASAALPGLFPPVRIGERHYVDGALTKTMHASVALEAGVDLLLCLNPIVPFHASGTSPGTSAIPSLVDGGLPAVLGQTFRSLVHSRLALGMKHYERAYPHTDIVLLEPDRRDTHLYHANTFGYRQRRTLAAHAYEQTRALLRDRAGTLGPQLARHGVTLRTDVLREARQLLEPARPRRLVPALATLRGTLDELAARLQPQAG